MNEILMLAEGRFKWTIFSIFLPKSLRKSLLRRTATFFTQQFLLYLVTRKLLRPVQIIYLLTLQTPPVLPYLFIRRTKYKYIFWDYSEIFKI